MVNINMFLTVLSKFNAKQSSQKLPKLLKEYPTLVMGCKKDLVDHSKQSFMQIDAKVKSILKNANEADLLSHISYS